MASQINASNSGFGGIVSTGDSSGVLQLQTAATTALTIDASQRAAFVAGTAALPAITTTGDTDTGIWFPAANTVAASTSGTEAMRIDSSGNVGIGTTSPTKKFVVSNAGAVGMEWTPTDYTNNMRQLAYNRATSAYVALRTEALQHEFYNSGTEAMRIDSSGNLLVGTTTTRAKITTDFNGSTNNGIALNDTASASGALFVGFYNNGPLIGSVVRVGATSAVVYNTTSDERLKSNIVDSDSVLDTLMQVQVRQYDWTEGNMHQEYGFIAQELEPVLSGIVTKGKTDDDMWQLDYSRLTPHLVKAIQEQQTIINDLKARIETLEAK